MNLRSPKTAALALLTLVTLFRLWYCTHLELVPDEGYYFLWSKHLAPAYYSKGPAVAWTIALGTWIFGDNVFGIRWLSVLLSAGTGWQLFLLGRRLFDEKTGLAAMAVAAIVPLYGIGSILMTIDPLSVFFWVWAANLFWIALEQEGTVDWLWVGLAVGAGFLAKFTNALELIAFAAFLLWSPRRRFWLTRPAFYWMLLAFLVCTLPVIYWNATHGWITIAHLKERGGLGHHARHAFPALVFLGQQAMAISPLLFAGIVFSVWNLCRKPERSDAERYLLCLFFPVFAFYFFLSFGGATEANWTAISYIAGSVIFVVDWRRLLRDRKIRWARAVLACIVFLALVETAILHETSVLHLRAAVDPLTKARGWAQLGDRVEVLREQYHPTFLLGNRYQNASLLSFYLKGHPQTYLPFVPKVGNPWMIKSIDNQFSLWPSYDLRPETTALLVTDEIDGFPDSLYYHFTQVQKVATIPIVVNGQTVREFDVYFADSPRPEMIAW